MKLTPRQWIKKLSIKCEILDPDGWNRSNWRKSWREKIDRDLFFDRMDSSTCIHRKLKTNRWCSCVMARPELVEEYSSLDK